MGSGWPKQGNTDGKAVPNPANQKAKRYPSYLIHRVTPAYRLLWSLLYGIDYLVFR